MADTTRIEWCDSTFNPWIGCTKVSPACDSCYASVSTPVRAMNIEWGAGKPRHRTSLSTWRQPLLWERQHEQFFKEHGRRRRVFCASLADVFDNDVYQHWRADLFRLIEQCTNLDWLLLTKRIGNAHEMLDQAMHDIHHPRWDAEDWPQVWLGATIANQAEADRDIPKLLATPARVRFLSCEPLLGPINLAAFLWECCGNVEYCDYGCYGSRAECCGTANSRDLIDWVIAGGESGGKARPSHPDWFRSLRDQCAAADVAFQFKQWGEFLPRTADEADPFLHDVSDSKLYWSDGQKWDRFDGQRGGVELVARVGKKAAGRTLDGRVHDAFPVPQ